MPPLARITASLPLCLAMLVAVALVPAGCAPEKPPTPNAAPVTAPEIPPGADAAPGELRIVGRVPLDGEAFEGRLTLFFNEGLAPMEDPDSALTFSPPLPGSTAIRGNTLDFRASEGTPERIYTLSLGPEIRGASGQGTAAGSSLTLPTYVFRAQRSWVVAYAADHTMLAVEFSAPVDAASIQPFITVLKPGDTTPLPISVEPGTDSTLVRVRVDGVTEPPLEVQVAAGCPQDDGALKTTADASFSPQQENALRVESTAWARDPSGQVVMSITFNDTVPDARAAEFIALAGESGEPLRYTVHQDYGSPEMLNMTVIDPVAVGETISLTVRTGLTSESNRKVEADYTEEIETSRGDLYVNYDYWRMHDIAGQILRLELNAPVILEELEKHLSVRPALDGMKIEQAGRGEFDIKGAWRAKTQYTLEFSAGLQSQRRDFAVNEAFTHSIDEVPRLEGARFAFPGKYYFPKRGGSEIILESRNVSSAKVAIYRLFPSNVQVALEDMFADSVEDSYMSYRARQLQEQWSELLSTTDITMSSSGDTLARTPVRIDTLFPPDRKGVYSIAVNNPKSPLYTGGEDEDVWSWSRKVILWTDIGLLAHWDDDELVVAAHDLFSLAPIADAKITVYSQKNQVLGTAATDVQGLAQLKDFQASLGKPRLIVAESGDDFTLLELEAREDDPTGFTDSMPRYDQQGYDAFLYADRDLYRPGETVHLRCTMRTNYGDAVAGVPFQWWIRRPNDSDLPLVPVTMSPLGTASYDLETEKTFPTGKYTVHLVVPGEKKPLGTYHFSIEEFVPSRIKAEVTVANAVWLAGQEQQFSVNVQHLFGAPAADFKAEGSVLVQRATFEPEGWKGYRFTNDTRFTPDIYSTGEAKTNADGNADFTFVYKPLDPVTFPLSAQARAFVAEPGGRGIGARTEALLFPSDICLGVSVAGAPDRDSIEVNVAAIRPDGTPAALGEVQVTLEEKLWHYYVRRFSSYNEPNWSERFETVKSETVKLRDGRGTLEMSLPNYGRFRVRVHAPETPQFSTVSFSRYWGWLEVESESRPSLIKLTAARPVYSVGEEAVIRVDSPFDGKGYLVFQCGDIQRIIAIDVKDKVGEARFLVGPEHVPNVWVHATIVHQAADALKHVYPFSSFAMLNVPVQDPARRVKISFSGLPEEYRPAQDIQLTLETRDNTGMALPAEITLAAVDEGIHLLSGYRNPDPVAWLFRPRKPVYRRAHYYDLTAYDFNAPAPGGDARFAKGLADVGENWIKPVALWTGPVQTDAEGKATVTLSLPEFSGQLRLVAVAATDKALGSNGASVFVRRPYTLRTSMPRFLLPGDTAQCRASVYSTAKEPCRARIDWAATGAVQTSGGTRELDLPAGGHVELLAEFTGGPAAGAGVILWTVTLLDSAGQTLERLEEQSALPVNRASSWETDYEMVTLNPGEAREFRNGRFVEDERVEVQLTASANPAERLRKSLEWVAGYPHGCVEQLTSRCLPIYLLRKAEGLVNPALLNGETTSSYLQSGVSKLFNLQNSSGGLGTWPGDTTPYPYGSVYACHFLTLVRRDQEIPVADAPFRRLQDYVRTVMQGAAGTDASSTYLRAYALYVLALDGDLGSIQQIERFDNVTVPVSARYLLGAALALNTEDSDRVARYLDQSPAAPFEDREQGGTLNSSIRNTAVELLAQIHMNAPASAMQERADRLMRDMTGLGWYSTQERSFSISALGLYLERLGANVDSAAAMILGPGGQAPLQGRSVIRQQHNGPGGVFTITNTGQTPIFATFTAGGIPVQPDTSTYSEHLTLRSTVRTTGGETMDIGALAHGARYLVELRFGLEQETKNLIIEDLLPAGFEVENPRLDADALAGIKLAAAVTPSYLDLRDDRINLAFNELAAGEYTFYYLVRAVTPGVFFDPAVTGECMYDASIRARAAAGNVEIK